MSLNRLIAVTIDDATEEGAMAAVDYLRKSGWRSQLYHLRNNGGLAMEYYLQQGHAAAVLDYTLGDIAATSLNGRDASGPDRLTSASLLGLPQVIVPGSLDHVAFSGVAPSFFDLRQQHHPDDYTTLVRTSAEENDSFGREIAYKASASPGKVTVVFPLGGLSPWDGESRPLHDPAANQTLLDSIYLWKTPQVNVVESHRHINDHHFAQIAADNLLKMLVERQTPIASWK